MHRTVLFALPLLSLFACGGDDSSTEECETPAPMDVEVTVFWPDGTTLVEDLPDPEAEMGGGITLDGVACTNEGAGVYHCVAQADGSWQLAIVDTRFNAYSEFLQLPPFECGSNPKFVHSVQMGGMMGS